MSAAAAVSLLKCPRCGAGLLENGVSCEKWRAHWRCDDCLMAWHFCGGILVQGRSSRSQSVDEILAEQAQRESGVA